MNESFPYSGDESLRPAIEEALARVIDPEMALDILSIGLVYGVEATCERVKVLLTMTSAACPMGELIVADIEDAKLTGHVRVAPPQIRYSRSRARRPLPRRCSHQRRSMSAA